MSDRSRDIQALEARIRELEVALAQQQTDAAAHSGLNNDPGLHASDQLTELIFQTNRSACFSWIAASNQTVFSRNCRQCLGYEAAPPVSQTLQDGVPEAETNGDFIKRQMTAESRQLNDQCIRQCIRTGESQSAQLQLIKPDGTSGWFELRVIATERDQRGRTERIIGTLTDIDQLKQRDLDSEEKAATERWLRMLLRGLLEDDSEEVMRQTLAYVGDHMELDYCALRAIDTDTQCSSLSYLWEKSPELARAYPFEKLDLQQLPMLRTALETAKPLLVTNENVSVLLDPPIAQHLKRLDNFSIAIIPLQYRGKVDAVLSLVSLCSQQKLNESSLEIAQIIGDAMARAISRQRLHKKLALRDERYAYALDATRDGLWDWNLMTGELHFSSGYLRMLGYEPHEVPYTHETFQQIFLYPEDVNYVINVTKEAYNSESGLVVCEFRMRHKNGKLVWIYSRAKYVDRDEQGRPRRCVGVNSDISQFKATQAELRQAKVEAIAANQTKNEFLTRMSHEIRTPMNAIIGMGHLLKDTSLNQKQHDYLLNINESADSLLHIIDEILDFSKLESGKFLLENSHFDLDEVYDQLSQSMRAKAEEKNIELIFDVAHDVPRFIKGDSRRLYQVLHNLLDNAVKFTEQGEITIRSRKLPLHNQQVNIEFSVIDSGIGIDPRDLEHLFDPFTQADGSTSRRFGGTGLGLTICRYLVDQMHGEISVNSLADSGSCFSFTALFDQSQLGETPLHHQPQKFNGLRTLIVDDHPSALAVLEKTATSLKLDVATANCAELALTLMCDRDKSPGKYFELVLMDFDMPRINGLEACKMIRQHPSLKHQPKSILISSYSRDEIEAQEPITNVDGFIHKPITPSRIFDAVAVAFGESLFQQIDPTVELTESEQDDSLQGARVLLAEDNLINQKVAIGILKKKGVEVIVANNGLEAIDLLQAHESGHFGAILMDMEMPEMDGYQATRTIRQGECQADITIIAMTAHALQGDRERCLQTGMDDYITKPVNPQLLYKTLAKYLSRHNYNHNQPDRR